MTNKLETKSVILHRLSKVGEYSIDCYAKDMTSVGHFARPLLKLKGSNGWQAIQFPFAIDENSAGTHPNHPMTLTKFGTKPGKYISDHNGHSYMGPRFCWLLQRDNKLAKVALIPGPAVAEMVTPKMLEKSLAGKAISNHVRYKHNAVGVWWLVDIHCYIDEGVFPVLTIGPNTRPVAGTGEPNMPAEFFNFEINPYDTDGRLLAGVESTPEGIVPSGDYGYVSAPSKDVLKQCTSKNFNRQKFKALKDHQVTGLKPSWQIVPD